MTPVSGPKNTRITIRLHPVHRSQLQKLAAADNRREVDYVRTVLTTHLLNHRTPRRTVRRG